MSRSMSRGGGRGRACDRICPPLERVDEEHKLGVRVHDEQPMRRRRRDLLGVEAAVRRTTASEFRDSAAHDAHVRALLNRPMERRSGAQRTEAHELLICRLRARRV